MAKKKANGKASSEAGKAKATPAPEKTKRIKKSPPAQRQKATPRAAASKPAAFEEAKNAAIDALIRSIEENERKLSAAKKARSIDELPKL